MDYGKYSDLDLVKLVLGAQHAERHYQGSLAPLFSPTGAESWAQARMRAAHEILKRWMLEDLKRKEVMREPIAVRNYLATLYAGQGYESFTALFLDSQHRLIEVEELSRGTLDGASVYPREVVKRVIRLNAAAVIFAHNHPSGVSEPSAADRALTDRLKSALAVIDVRVLDHFVVGGSTAVSFAERGWL